MSVVHIYGSDEQIEHVLSVTGGLAIGFAKAAKPVHYPGSVQAVVFTQPPSATSEGVSEDVDVTREKLKQADIAYTLLKCRRAGGEFTELVVRF